MEQTGEYRIAARRDDVWAALNDPQVLARCIDGCQSMTSPAPDQFDALVKARVGPVSATFQVAMTLEDVQPPESYTIKASVKGGAAGFARGEARVRLHEESAASTRLEYTVKANVGGKLAQVGSRLIDATARKMAEAFFTALQRELGVEAPPPEVEAPRAYQTGGNWMIWLAAFIALLLALLFAW